MDEQKVINEIRETYKNTYANCIYVMTSKMIGMEEENARLREVLDSIEKNGKILNEPLSAIRAREALKKC